MKRHGFPDTFEALPAGVDFQFLTCLDASSDLNRYGALLSNEELERRDGFKSDRRRVTFTMGRAAARTLVARHLACSPREVPLAVADDGAVDIVGSDLHLSISHTDERAVAVVAAHPVGVDLEPVDRRMTDLHSYILNEDEYARLVEEGHEHLPVLESWVAKESVLKGMRTGLRTSPKELMLRFDERGGLAYHRNGAVWRFMLVQRDGFFVSVAFEQ